MKITKSHLKELIKQSLAEIDFKDKEAFKKYNAKHKMRKSTKVNISGKDTTVGDASDDVGGPAHPNVPKKKKNPYAPESPEYHGWEKKHGEETETNTGKKFVKIELNLSNEQIARYNIQ